MCVFFHFCIAENDPLIDRVSYTGNISSSDEFQLIDTRHAKVNVLLISSSH